MNLRILREAELEMQAAACWYDDQRAGLGSEFLDAVAQACETIEFDPQRFSNLETVHASRRVRRLLLPRFPYLIIFEERDDEALILAIAHACRRPNYWKERK